MTSLGLLPIRVVKVVLPYPPSANAYWRLFTPKGKGARPRVIVSEAGRLYKELVADMLAGKLGTLLAGPLFVEVEVFRPLRARDLSNNPKILEDALQGSLFVNDGQTVRMQLEHWDTEPHDPRVQVTVTEDFNPRTPPVAWRIRPEDRAKLERAKARLEALAEKERAKRREKEAKKKTPPMVAPSHRTPLPSGSSPGTQSYGSRHDLRRLATSASYPRGTSK
jgi:crossover junction endodeoxyribonuclease RusA